MLGSLNKIILSLLVSTMLSVMALPQIQTPEPLDGSGWRIEVVRPDDDEWGGASIAIDRNGYPHISFSQDDAFDLLYGRWTGTSWKIEVVDSVGQLGSPSSLALDSNDRPRIGYFSRTDQSIKYAQWTGSSWINETVDSSEPPISPGSQLSLALDSRDYPHISYEYGSHRGVKYARWNGSSWNYELVDQSVHVGDDTSIAVDSGDNPHILYYDGDNYDVRYARWNGSAWISQIVDRSGYINTPRSLALDANDNPHVSYRDIINRDLKYARWDGNTWINETVDTADNVGWTTSIALDSSDFPHIAYADFTSFDIKYARWNVTAWVIETVDTSGVLGIAVSLALDSNDQPHIAYLNDTGSNIMYATKADLQPPPILSYSPSHIDFGDLYPGVQDTKSFEIWNSGEGTLQYSFLENIPWIAVVSPSHGSSDGEHDIISVSIDTTGLSSGQYAGDVLISSNGGEGNVSVSARVVETRSLTLDIDPDTLNLKSKGRWITAYLTTDGANADEIDASSLLLNDVLSPERWEVQNNITLMAKFNRAAVQAILPISEAVDIKITGQWMDGETFELHDIIRVILPGRVPLTPKSTLSDLEFR
ncbi:MAG: hypothetical protein KAR39_09845 [Thermoplasmata archaeon]|nr:hypothetical protein [Thermoplasmata archaeon]